MSTEPLPPYPDRAKYTIPHAYGPAFRSMDALAEYERARAEAALARLRYLVDVVYRYDTHADLVKALTAIGAIPE